MGERPLSKPFFVGIGAQKAGTSWLGRYFAQHPQVGFSPFKELHYFDAVYCRDHCGVYDQRFADVLKNYVSGMDETPSPEQLLKIRCATLRLEMVADPRRYVDYFELLAEEQHRIVGEITPAYSLLAEDGFAAIRKLIPDARFLFVVRDPIDRFWSHLRFHETQLGSDRFDALAEVEAKLAAPPFVLRTDYKRTLIELRKVVPARDVCVLFYEHLVHPDTHARELAKLTKFLGIDYLVGNLEERAHPSKVVELPRDAKAMIASTFVEVYNYVEETFGDELPERWREHLTFARTGSSSSRS